VASDVWRTRTILEQSASDQRSICFPGLLGRRVAVVGEIDSGDDHKQSGANPRGYKGIYIPNIVKIGLNN